MGRGGTLTVHDDIRELRRCLNQYYVAMDTLGWTMASATPDITLDRVQAEIERLTAELANTHDTTNE